MNNDDIKLLIISDRLQDKAKALAEYLCTLEGFKVLGIGAERQEVLEIADSSDFDYLIVAGYLRNERSYQVIQDLKKRSVRFLPVHWAMLDPLIDLFCSRYKIPLKFERTLPKKEFADFLIEHKKYPLLS